MPINGAAGNSEAAAGAAKTTSSSSGLSDPPAMDGPDVPALNPQAAQESVKPADGHGEVATVGKDVNLSGTSTVETTKDDDTGLSTTTGHPGALASTLEATNHTVPLAGGPANSGDTIKTEGNGTSSTPAANRSNIRGRPRGRGRGGARGKGGKRKREEREDAGSSSSEEIYTPAASMTKSGRSIQKPTSYVPAPEPSPVSGTKRKKTYRRNPESAVCKVCLRGTSPASNMIVFCDGCNTPYHRYCHHPPIDQSVVDEVDKEWYCKPCENQRVVPVPDAEVSDFVAAEGASVEQRQRYFASLPQGMLVTLLTKATSLKPDLPLFAPNFKARGVGKYISEQPMENGGASTQNTSTTTTSSTVPPSTVQNGQVAVTGAAQPSTTRSGMVTGAVAQAEAPLPPEHPPHYPRPGHGLMATLPPDQEDLQWLVDDNDRSGAFTHLYR